MNIMDVMIPIWKSTKMEQKEAAKSLGLLSVWCHEGGVARQARIGPDKMTEVVGEVSPGELIVGTAIATESGLWIKLTTPEDGYIPMKSFKFERTPPSLGGFASDDIPASKVQGWPSRKSGNPGLSRLCRSQQGYQYVKIIKMPRDARILPAQRGRLPLGTVPRLSPRGVSPVGRIQPAPRRRYDDE